MIRNVKCVSTPDIHVHIGEVTDGSTCKTELDPKFIRMIPNSTDQNDGVCTLVLQ